MDKKITKFQDPGKQNHFPDTNTFWPPDNMVEGMVGKESCPKDVQPAENPLEKEKPTPPIGGIVGGILAVFAIAATYGWITGFWGTVETIATVIAVAIGSIAAFLVTDKFGFMFLITEAVVAVLLWIAAAVADFILQGFSIDDLLGDILFGWIVTIPICAFPALIGSTIATVLKKLFVLLKRC